MKNVTKGSREHSLILTGLDIFKPYERCWMDYKIDRNNPLTFHHIVPKKEKGQTVLTNMAMISKNGHIKLNLIERRDYIIAKQLNRLFQQLNDTMLPPTEEYYDELHYYIEKFERRRMRIYIK